MLVAALNDDLVIDPALQLFMAERIGATTNAFADASHVGGFTRYAKSSADLIEEDEEEPPRRAA